MDGIAVNGRFLDRPVTGVERYAREIMHHLGSHVRIVRPKSATRGLYGHVWEQLALPRTLNDDVLWSPANTGPLRISRQVLTIHDISPVEHPEWFNAGLAAWYRYLLPRLVRCVSRIVTVSAFSKSRIIERLGAQHDQIVVIANGVSDRFSPHPHSLRQAERPAARPRGFTGPYILTVGSLEPRKNLERLFAAWQLSGLAREGCALAVAGGRGISFRRIEISAPPPGVRLLGYVPEPELPALYRNALAFVVVSLYEGFGLPALEAMASGVPVIAARAGGLPETVGDAALVVDPTSPEAITDGLRQVLGDRALRDCLARRGVEHSRGFSWHRAATRLVSVLEDASHG